MKRQANPIVLFSKNENTDKTPINSASKLTAQYNKLLPVPSSLAPLISSITNIISPSSGHPLRLRILIELLFNSGIRISEALRIHSSDISANGSVFIRGSKKSGDRFIYSSMFRLELLKLRSINAYLFSDYSRFFVYRFLKSNGIFLAYSSGSNKSVTHAFRHLATSIDNSDISHLNALKSFINHRSSISTLHYINRNNERK